MSEAGPSDLPLILRLLVTRGAMEEEQLRDVPKARATHPDCLEEALVLAGLATDTDIAEAYADYLSLPLLEPKDGLADSCRDAVARVPETICRTGRMVPVSAEDGVLHVACLNPTDLSAQEQAQLLSGCVTQPMVAPYSLLEQLMGELFGARDMVREIAGDQDPAEAAEADMDGPIEADEDVVDLDRAVPPGKDGQIIKIVNLLLGNAITDGVSDIHIEPYEKVVRVRYRLDGKLIEVTPPPRNLFIPVLSRLKVLSKMDIAERRIPQDGAISAKLGSRRVDLRVSTVPTVYGEKMVLRILAKEATPDCLTKLGFSEKQSKDFEEAANSPHGLVFVTGPTGSGKSTTLYTCLNLINRPTHNIVTVEDPVEYRFDGLNQSQVHSAVGMTFQRALRAFLRQDPDIIMLGEVRDQETADICLRAALTGHLVLSTLHTNDSLQAVNRLMDMGIEPFLLGPALRVVQAQRLARRLCEGCKEPFDLPAHLAEQYEIDTKHDLFRPKKDGCKKCRGSGYKGRVGIFEVIRITEDLGRAITVGKPLNELYEVAAEAGMQFLADSAREKVIEGVTSVDEVSDYLCREIEEEAA
ncbi:MAG: ATPase, T2SS/T4P/T4SS family [Planctomycetota bacterium]|nr:ATPase, T2SS/T4P/T4SS family [Planctomycetota bacterium]